MIRSIFIVSATGEVLIEKHWRGVTSRSVCDFFWDEVNKVDHREWTPPVMVCPGTSTQQGPCLLLHVMREGEDVFALATVDQEVPPLLVLEFLHRVLDVLAEYFGTVDDVAIKDNFSLVYQLLEEMIDNGYPLTTEPNALKAMITPPSVMGRVVAAATGKSGVSNVLPDGTISSMPWRKAGVKYSQNEIYLDVIEEVDCIIGPSGQVVTSEVSGSIQAVSHLSGIPDLLLTFADPEVIDDCSFHPCVRYNRFERDRTVSFVPPDGAFELMRYSVANTSGANITPPIYCTPTISFSPAEGGAGGGKGRIHVNVGCRPASSLRLPSKKGGAGSLAVEDVILTIQLPRAVRTANLTSTSGTVLFDEATKLVKWTVGKIGPKNIPQLTGVLLLVSGEQPEESPPVQLSWKVPVASVSGLAIASLLLTNEKYKPYKGVRVLTRGKVTARTHS
jgi:AP-3 complex subunit mu